MTRGIRDPSGRSTLRGGRPNDFWGNKAKSEGFPARSVYKLEEIDRRVRLFRPGMRVLDLGAFPGSWTLYAAKKVGPQGRVLGLDIQEFKGGLPANAEIRHLDIRTLDPVELGRFDVVISDMAPNTIGTRSADQAKSFELFMLALEAVDKVLAQKGAFVGKIFQGPDFENARLAVRDRFATSRIIKPEASRSESYETFLVGLEHKASTAP